MQLGSRADTFNNNLPRPDEQMSIDLEEYSPALDGAASEEPMTGSYASKDSGFQEEEKELDANYLSIQITVYKNGAAFDRGTKINITRKDFKHWIYFMDYLTSKLAMTTPVNHLFSIGGEEIHHFRFLEDNGQYVAAISPRFIHLNYGQHRQKVVPWNFGKPKPQKDPASLNSHESLDIFLTKKGYQSKTGRQFPEDYDLEESDFDLRPIVRARKAQKLNEHMQLAAKLLNFSANHSENGFISPARTISRITNK